MDTPTTTDYEAETVRLVTERELVAQTVRTTHDPSGNPRAFVVLYEIVTRDDVTGDGPIRHALPVAVASEPYGDALGVAVSILAGNPEPWRSLGVDAYGAVHHAVAKLPDRYVGSVREWRAEAKRYAQRDLPTYGLYGL